MDQQAFTHLIQQARTGDQTAAGELFKEAFWTLHACVAPMIDDVMRRGRWEPEDVIQEVYAAAFQNLRDAEFVNSAAFMGWLKTIATNKVSDLREKLTAKKRDVRLQLPGDAGSNTSSYMHLVDRLAATNPSPTRVVARKEALAVLAAQMWRLPDEYRRVVQWRFVQDVSVAEVARTLNKSEPAIHMLCHRALKKLAELMGSSSRYLTRD